MTTADTLSQLPDDTRCYVPPVGEVTLGEIRATEEEPAVDTPSWEVMVAAVQATVTRNLCREPWESSGGGPSGRRESTA